MWERLFALIFRWKIAFNWAQQAERIDQHGQRRSERMLRCSSSMGMMALLVLS